LQHAWFDAATKSSAATALLNFFLSQCRPGHQRHPRHHNAVETSQPAQPSLGSHRGTRTTWFIVTIQLYGPRGSCTKLTVTSRRSEAITLRLRNVPAEAGFQYHQQIAAKD
jgi:hypothetical protein